MSKWAICIILILVLVATSATPNVYGELGVNSLCPVSGGEKTMSFEGCPGDPMSGYITVTNTGEVGLGGAVSTGEDCSWLTIAPKSFGLAPGQSVKMDFQINTNGFEICKTYRCRVTINITFENGVTDILIYNIVVTMKPPSVSFAKTTYNLGTLCPTSLPSLSEHRIKLYINNTGCEGRIQISGKTYSIPARTMGYLVDVTISLEPPSPTEIPGTEHLIYVGLSLIDCASMEYRPLPCVISYRWSSPPEFTTEPIKFTVKGGESKKFEVKFKDIDDERLRLVVRPPFRGVSQTNESALITINTSEEDIGKILKTELELTDMCHTVTLPVEVEVVDSIYPPFITEPLEFPPVIITPSGVIVVIIETIPVSEPPDEIKDEYDKPIIEVGDPQIGVTITSEDGGIKIEASPDAERGCDIAIVKITVGDREIVKLIPIIIEGGE